MLPSLNQKNEPKEQQILLKRFAVTTPSATVPLCNPADNYRSDYNQDYDSMISHQEIRLDRLTPTAYHYGKAVATASSQFAAVSKVSTFGAFSTMFPICSH